MMETWQELKVTVKREGEELVSNLLIELGAQGVAIEDILKQWGIAHDELLAFGDANNDILYHIKQYGCQDHKAVLVGMKSKS